MNDAQRIADLEAQLRERAEVDIVARTAAMAAARVITDADQVATQAAVDVATKEQARRGLWVADFITKADPKSRIDIAAIAAAIPADSNAFPPGIDPATLTFDARPAPPVLDFKNSTLGRLFHDR